jgi:signal-transduction protein with cAMP-binding, CBS, and nucleotidyltransferase domain
VYRYSGKVARRPHDDCAARRDRLYCIKPVGHHRTRNGSRPEPPSTDGDGDKTMTSVAQILKSKTEARLHHDHPVITIDADKPVFDAVRLMSDLQIGALIVTEGPENKIAGIITERDYARKIVLMDRSSKTTPVREIMTTQVRCVGLTDTAEDCMALMTNFRMRHLPVIENDRLVGMVSIGDLVKSIISEQQFTIQQLEHYITGART